MLRSVEETSRMHIIAESCLKDMKKMSRICAPPHLGVELLKKMGDFRKKPEKEVETQENKEKLKKE